MQQRLLKSFLICLSLFVVLTVMMIFSSRIHIGFMGDLSALIFGTLFTSCGVVIGDMFRRFVMPDLVFASGSFDMLCKKVFWLIGPQAIGWLIGYMGYQGFMRNVLGFYI